MAELADARDGRIVWSQRFQGDVADVFAMQGELARKVVQSLAPYVRSLELKRARITNFEQLDAYAITLRGVELMHRLSPEDFLQARTAFETAVARDPVSPRAHAWLAKWYVMRVANGISENAASDSTAATASAERALACDADDALALSVSRAGGGMVNHDLDAAELNLTQALNANPNEPLAWLGPGLPTRGAGGRRGGAMRRPRLVALAPRPDDLLFQLARQQCQPDRRAIRAVDRARRAIAARESLTYPNLRTLAVARRYCRDGLSRREKRWRAA